jgi:hypothetical protein
MPHIPSELAALLFDENHRDLVTAVLEEHKALLDTAEQNVYISRFASIKHTKKKKAEEQFISNLEAFNAEAIQAHIALGERLRELNLEVKHLLDKWKNKPIDFENETLRADFQRIIYRKTRSLLSEFSGKLMYRLGDEIVLSHGDLKDRLNPSYFIRWKFYFTYALNSSSYTAKETGDRSLKEDRSKIRRCVVAGRSRIRQNDNVYISFQLGRKKTKDAVVYLQKDLNSWKLTYKKDKETGWYLDSKTDRFSLFGGR